MTRKTNQSRTNVRNPHTQYSTFPVTYSDSDNNLSEAENTAEITANAYSPVCTRSQKRKKRDRDRNFPHSGDAGAPSRSAVSPPTDTLSNLTVAAGRMSDSASLGGSIGNNENNESSNISPQPPELTKNKTDLSRERTNSVDSLNSPPRPPVSTPQGLVASRPGTSTILAAAGGSGGARPVPVNNTPRTCKGKCPKNKPCAHYSKAPEPRTRHRDTNTNTNTSSDEASDTEEPQSDFMNARASLPPILISNRYQGDICKINREYVSRYQPLAFHCQKIQDGTKITVSCRRDYINLERILKEREVPYRILPDLNDKPYKVVLKGIDPYCDPAYIAHSLMQFDLRVLKVVRMTSFKTRKPLPMFLVDLQKTQNSRKILTIDKLCYFNIKVEEYKQRKVPPQCSRCQAYFHTAGRCRAPPQCRYCAGIHYTRECDSPRDAPPVCALCQGEHTANFRGCPEFRDIMERVERVDRTRNQRSEATTNRQAQRENPVPTRTGKTNTTWTDIVKGNSNHSNNTISQNQGTQRATTSKEPIVNPQRRNQTYTLGPLPTQRHRETNTQAGKQHTQNKSHPCECRRCPKHQQQTSQNWEEKSMAFFDTISPHFSFRQIVGGLFDLVDHLRSSPTQPTFPETLRYILDRLGTV